MPFNPFARWRITGTWAAHMSYSAGGEDYPLPYGTVLPAPAAGTLHTSGRPRLGSEFQCGQVGSAGRRSILMLDRPIRDVVAVVFQHQSAFGYERHYDEGATCGWSGASANGRDWGGDVHLHIHCLTASGQRRRFTDYFGSIASSGPSVPAGGISSPIAAPSGQATPTAKEFDFTMPMPQDVRDYFDEHFKAATQDHANIGSNTDRRAESLKKTIQEEGALLKVLFNRASGIYSLASVGLKYWWELGQDINKATPQETWQARKEFGEGTLAIYRERGFAQTWVHELDEEEWNFYRMLCTNTPTNPSDENLAHLASVIAKQNTLLETIAAKIGVTGLA